ncbi:MAG TPA: hypothetical protein VNJ50_02055 [Gelidibacter sp.]|uniref:hypothetical protein n=1 Tax=Gelidibacter sp. TaxID=2018083 RepID=UPI002C48FAB9|nr:hypothetical protein [Gelidibacter sp.]HXJ97605.1 hypothetical protein [Gelidibacter sp.]
MQITKENYSQILESYISENKLEVRKISKVMDCTIPTLERLLKNQSIPSDEMIKQTGILIALGFVKYSKLSNTEKEKYSENLGVVSGAGIGFASITAVVSGLGTAGLSGAGIMSGLATIGGFVGAGAAAGTVVVAAVPILTGAAGYGLIKGIKHIIGNYNQKAVSIDKRWEISK